MSNDQPSITRKALGSAGDAVRRLNPSMFASHQPSDSRPATELEPNPGNGALGTRQVQATDSGRFLVRVTSVRKRLLDEDNLCEKYHIDCCRYAGLLPGDAPGTTKIEVCQEKVEAGRREEVRIDIFKLK